MQADYYYTIGKGHEYCQDYGYATTHNGLVRLAICDGCSSAPLSHVGAGILAHSALVCIDRYNFGEITDGVLWSTLQLAESTARNIGIPMDALSATLLYLVEYPDEILVQIVGDGHVMLVYDDNSIKHYHRHYDNNAPRYLRYYIDTPLLIKYEAEFGGVAKFKRTLYSQDLSINNMYTISENTNISEILTIPKAGGIKMLVLSTDGVDSFVPNIDAFEILKQLSELKSTTGLFLRRRIKRILANLRRDNYTHEDDIGIGAVVL